MKRTLSLLFVFVLLLTGCIGQALADVSINNQIKDGTGNAVTPGPGLPQKSGLELILATGDQYQITMPNTYSYIQPVSMYIDAPGDHSIYVYKELDCDKEKLMPFAYEGMRVTAVAEQMKDKTALTCIVYPDENYRLHAGWVHSKYLNVWFPGAVKTIGSRYEGDVFTAKDPTLSWARDYFVNTKQKYTLLNEPIRECTQFLLNYQVTGRGGAQVNELLGPRTVYVNDGSGWIMVGQFDYNKIQAVLVTVNLTEPTDLLAVAVIPSCSRPDRFTFRQAVQDVLTASFNTPSVQGGLAQGSGMGELIVVPTPTPLVISPLPEAGIRKGSVVTFGNYEQDNYAKGSREPIEWIVLDVQDDRVLLISRYGLDCVSYCSRQETVAWESSRVRSWLNSEFLNAAFTGDEQSHILLTDVDNSRSQGYIHYEGDGGNDTQDRIFLLSYAEAWRYFYQSSDRVCKPTRVAVKRGVYESPTGGHCPWWLRSPGYTADHVTVVDVDGNRGCSLKYGATAIRPAMWVDSSAVQAYWRNSK